MSLSRPRIPFTYEDYKSLPESMTHRYELLAGDLFMVPSPTIRHQQVSQNIEFIFIRIACSRSRRQAKPNRP